MRLVNQHKEIRAFATVLPDVLELVNHGDDEAEKILVEKFLKPRPRLGVGDFDLAALHLPDHLFNPSGQLPFQLVTVNDQHHGRAREVLPVLQDEPGRRNHRERLAGPLRVPDEAGLFRRVGASPD